MKKYILTLSIIIILSLFTGCNYFDINESVDSDDKTEIVILHDNDQHFEFNNWEEIKEYKRKYSDEYGDEKVFLFNGGDIFQRRVDDLERYEKEAYSMINKMNKIGYDVMTLGNHEIAYKEHITKNALIESDFPILGANLEVQTDKFITPESKKIFEAKDKKIGVLGLAFGDADKVYRSCAVETARKYSYLSKHTDLFIALTHLGYYPERDISGRDIPLAKEVGELDIIIGGHSHTALYEPDVVNDVHIAQAGSHNKYLGKLKITFKNGVLKNIDGKLLEL